MEGQSGLSELSVISWVSAVEGCPLSGVPLYTECKLKNKQRGRAGNEANSHTKTCAAILELTFRHKGCVSEIMLSSHTLTKVLVLTDHRSGMIKDM